MKNFIAVISEVGGKIAKYQDFDTQAEADAHVATYGGFAAANPGSNPLYWVVDMNTQSLTYDSAQETADAAANSKAASIAALENQVTVRMLREASIDATHTFPQGHPRAGQTAKQAIADIDAAIEAIRNS